jgi:SAM-dependent methyltransferase
VARLLSEGYPDLEQRGVDYFSHAQADTSSIDRALTWASRLVPLGAGSRVAVLGCGPRPATIRALLDSGHSAVGIEPVAGHVATAREFLGSEEAVLVGSAESIPLADESQQVVVAESVLEHVDSVAASLAETYRVLAPGGVLYVVTTNRYAIRNGEFRPRLYQWFPATVKESYVFKHLHYDPSLADFTPRPAVHWFSFAELCQHGRRAGFSQFYSPIDLVAPDSPAIRRRLVRRLLIGVVQRNPWARALFLTLSGDTIFMLKRKATGPSSHRTATGKERVTS